MGNVDHGERLAGILECGNYFGLPLGASYKVKHIWDGVIEKIEHQLASWKMMY